MECRKCNVNKDSTEFYVNRHVCKLCCNKASTQWQRDHREQWNQIVRKAEKKIPKEVKREWTKKFHERNPDWKRQYYQENRHIWIHGRRLRAQRLKDRTPSWADLDKIKEIYRQARDQHLEVDHIIPLQGELVSGLHVENNLQLLSKAENRKKKNKYVDHDFERYPRN